MSQSCWLEVGRQSVRRKWRICDRKKHVACFQSRSLWEVLDDHSPGVSDTGVSRCDCSLEQWTACWPAGRHDYTEVFLNVNSTHLSLGKYNRIRNIATPVDYCNSSVTRLASVSFAFLALALALS